MPHISVGNLGDATSGGSPMGGSSSTNRMPKTIAGGDLYPPWGGSEISHPAMQQISGHPIMQSMSKDDDDETSATGDSDDAYDTPLLTKDTEQFLSHHFSKIIGEAKAHLPAMMKKAMRCRAQNTKKALKEALQQVKDEAKAKQAELMESFQRQLQHKEEELQSLNQSLLNSEAQCSSLQSSLSSKLEHLAAVEAQMAAKTKECGFLNNTLDDKDFELETLRSKGRELLTFQGLTTPGADMSSLKVALRDLSDQLQTFTELFHSQKFAAPWVPHIVDIQGMDEGPHPSQLPVCAIKHTVLLVLAAVVFGTFESSTTSEPGSFYHSELAVLAGSQISSLLDSECTVLQLQLEQKVANYWLQSLCPWSANNMMGSYISSNRSDTTIIKKYTGLFMTTLLTGEKMQWDHSLRLDPTEVLKRAARKLVAAALKAQIIASAMHSQLIRIWVPGWLPSCWPHQHMPAAMASNATVPHSWDWPGVVPISKELMQPGVRLLASSAPGLFSEDDAEVAAVFCQEPAVVQIAERVGDLPGSVNARQQHSGVRSPYKVLIRARMAVATK